MKEKNELLVVNILKTIMKKKMVMIMGENGINYYFGICPIFPFFPQKVDIKQGRYTFWTWFGIYWGKTNTPHLELKEFIAATFNENRMNGLKLIEMYSEDKKQVQSLIIQQDNIDRNTHTAPELYQKDMVSLLESCGYQCDENLNINAFECFDFPCPKEEEYL